MLGQTRSTAILRAGDEPKLLLFRGGKTVAARNICINWRCEPTGWPVHLPRRASLVFVLVHFRCLSSFFLDFLLACAGLCLVCVCLMLLLLWFFLLLQRSFCWRLINIIVVGPISPPPRTLHRWIEGATCAKHNNWHPRYAAHTNTRTHTHQRGSRGKASRKKLLKQHNNRMPLQYFQVRCECLIQRLQLPNTINQLFLPPEWYSFCSQQPASSSSARMCSRSICL